MPKTKLIKNSC